MISTESQEQIGFVTWFRYKFPDVLLFHIPNGSFRTIVTAQRLKHDGVVPGVPDLMVPAWHLFIEMKRKEGGVISPEQKKTIDYLTRVGYTVIVGYGAEDASRKVLEFLKIPKF